MSNQPRVQSGVPTGGQFAAALRPETGIVLGNEGAAKTDTRPTYETLGLTDSGRKDTDGNPIYEGVYDDGQTRYEIATSPIFIRVDASLGGGVNAESWETRPSFAEPFGPADVAEHIELTQHRASSINGFNSAVRTWLLRSGIDYAKSDAFIDTFGGNFIHPSGVTIRDFNREQGILGTETGNPGLRDASASMTLRLGDLSPTPYHVALVPQHGGSGAFVNLYRGDDRVPLSYFETRAVEDEMARVIGAPRSIDTPRLSDLLSLALENAEYADEKAGIKPPEHLC